MGSSLDDLTRVLFARIRQEDNEPENALLKCPKCPNRLKPLLLDLYEEEGHTYQRVWWTCRGLKSKTCIYPLNMPTQVFWTRRTEEQMKQDVIPLPNFNLLPKEYWKLYPTLFKSPNQPATEMEINSDFRDFNDKILDDSEVEFIEDENSFDALKKREAIRKKRKSRARIPRDEDGRTPGKKKFRGVVSTRQTADSSARSKNGDSNAMRKPLPLRPAEERTVTGGRNFDFKIVEEATAPKQNSNRVQIFTDIQANLKTALSLRFAKKEFLDRLTGVISENTPVVQRDESGLFAKREMLQKVSEKFPMILEPPLAPVIKREKRSRSESRQPGTPEEGPEMDNDVGFVVTKKAIESFKKLEHASALSSRLGIKMEDFDTCSKRPASGLRTDVYMRVLQIGNRSETNVSTSRGSTNSGQEVPETQVSDPKSQELSASVQRHIQTLKAKMEKQRKKKVKQRKQEVARQPPQETVYYQNNPNLFINHDGYEHQQESHYQEPDQYNVDESDYGIFGDCEDELWGL
ncbi:hypothetical protein FO519_001871 [Halicephalobus sp. NKZ332]|nr:hypothetical protein FO519_001871 [Halicephalobus sp. NKZ332]